MNRLAIFLRFVCFFALILKVDGHFGDTDMTPSEESKGGIEYSHLWPSRMKDLRPFPRPVEAALPPSATVIADKTALFPPKSANQSIGYFEGIFDAYFRCGLQNKLAFRLKT